MKARFLLILILGCVFCLSDVAFAKRHTRAKKHAKTSVGRHSVRQAPILGRDQLAYALGSAINSSNTKADVAVYVKSMRTGDTLYTYNINKRMTPASTLKVLTAEAALIYLGSNYRFSTQLLTDAKSVKRGVLQGNLYVVLSGDPTLTYYDLLDLMRNLKENKIQSIAGNVYIDNTAYDQSFYGPGWEYKDKEYCYAAPISASIINHNCLSFKVAPSKQSNHLAASTSSKVSKNTRSRSCSLRLSKSPKSLMAIDGCIDKGRFAGVSYVVTDIPEYNRALFKSVLNQMGVSVYGSVTFGSAPSTLSLMGSHHSKPLSEVVKDMLKKSDNVIAGALFKKLGQLYTKQPGSWANGSLAVSQILSKKAGVNIAGMRILDGSGLSPDNLTTPAQMMQVLNFAYHHKGTSNDFIAALPIAGVDGTLKHRMYNIARKVRAKTGTISGVVSLAGYAKAGSEDELAFVILINGSKGFAWRYRALEDKIVTLLTRYRE